MRIQLGELNEDDALARVFDARDRLVVDVGCGAGSMARSLVQRGATVLGVEPDAVQARRNREAPPLTGLTFHQGPAQQLPVSTHSADVVLMLRSLHHVPLDEMDAALDEALRVIRREQGQLVVAEPDIIGQHTELAKPFHDETLVRTAAQAALHRLVDRHVLHSHRQYHYVTHTRFADFEAFVAWVVDQSFNRIPRERVDTPQVRELFAQGRHEGAEVVFTQPMLVDVFEPVR